MSKFVKIFTTISLVLMFSMGFSQVADITIEGMSPTELSDLGWTSPKSTGLSVVGVGELVYLSGREDTGATVTAYSWSITDQPGEAVLDSTDTPWTTFRPDVNGQFTIQLGITTADGSHDTSIVITSANFVGVSHMNGTTFSYPQCMMCHGEVELEWRETGHASMYTRAVDGLVSSGYASYCISCHVTGYNTDENADNGGFDDVAALYNWTLPSPLDEGNWDSLLTNFPMVARLTNIQCETCHGPGSEHNAAGPDASKIDMSLDDGVCGQCHESGSHHVFPTQWKTSGHGNMCALL